MHIHRLSACIYYCVTFSYVPSQQSLRNENESLHREVAHLKEQLRREKEAAADLAKEKVRKVMDANRCAADTALLHVMWHD